MNFLTTISDWVAKYSGQIQIGIAIIALFLAWKGYKKILEQLKEAKDQSIFQTSQRDIDLKLAAYNLISQNIDSNSKLNSQIVEVIDELKRIEKTNIKDQSKKEIKSNIVKMENQLVTIENTNSNLVTMTSDIKNINTIKDLDTIQRFLSTLAETQISSMNSYSSYIHTMNIVRKIEEEEIQNSSE